VCCDLPSPRGSSIIVTATATTKNSATTAQLDFMKNKNVDSWEFLKNSPLCQDFLHVSYLL